MEKTFKSLEEQIEIFESKGLVIDNKDYAREVLLRENYFFINAATGSPFGELYSI